MNRLTNRVASVAIVLSAFAAGAAEASAQNEDNSPGRLWIDLEAALPKRVMGVGKVGMRENPNALNAPDWPKTLDPMGLVFGRAQRTPVEPYAMHYLATFNFNAGLVDEAAALFEGIKQQFPDHPLCVVKLGQAGLSAVDEGLADCAKEKDWLKRYPRRVVKEPAINPDMKVVFSFPKGDVVIGLYDNVAPASVAQFVKNVEAGAFAQTIVGRVVPDQSVTLGQKESERGRIVPSDVSKGTLPPIPLEFSKASHLRGAVSMIRNLGQPESHGLLFEVILKDMPELNFQRTVFGKVLSGLEILDQVSRAGRDTNEYPATTVVLKDARVDRKKG